MRAARSAPLACSSMQRLRNSASRPASTKSSTTPKPRAASCSISRLVGLSIGRAGADDRRDASPAGDATACFGCRFAARLAFACRLAFRRFGAGFLAGHNMVPRHCGEPQRQA